MTREEATRKGPANFGRRGDGGLSAASLTLGCSSWNTPKALWTCWRTPKVSGASARGCGPTPNAFSVTAPNWPPRPTRFLANQALEVVGIGKQLHIARGCGRPSGKNAKAVVLDFVNPAGPRRRLFRWARKTRLKRGRDIMTGNSSAMAAGQNFSGAAARRGPITVE
jgi:hypothetical protein